MRSADIFQETGTIEKKGHGSATAQIANPKAAKEGKANLREASAAQAELGKKGRKDGEEQITRPAITLTEINKSERPGIRLVTAPRSSQCRSRKCPSR